MNDTTLDFVLEGRIYLEERDQQGNLLNKTEIDGNVVLQLLINKLHGQAVKVIQEFDQQTQDEPQYPFQFSWV